MIESIVLIEGDVPLDALTMSLINAKQIVLGYAGRLGTVLHVAATTSADLQEALLGFGRVPGVKGVITLAIKSF